MDDFNDQVMVALLPVTSEWCKIDLPHLTLVYAGRVQSLKPTDFNTLAKEASSLAALSRPVTLRVTGMAVFGDDDERVDVLRMQTKPELSAMRTFVESWNDSEHPFNPHVTVGPVGSVEWPLPTYIAFDRILVAWGSEHLTFWLKGA